MPAQLSLRHTDHRVDRGRDHPTASPRHDPGDTAADNALQDAARRCVSSEQLLAGHAEIDITHRGSTYHLRLTSLGKLILTK